MCFLQFAQCGKNVLHPTESWVLCCITNLFEVNFLYTAEVFHSLCQTQSYNFVFKSFTFNVKEFKPAILLCFCLGDDPFLPEEFAGGATFLLGRTTSSISSDSVICFFVFSFFGVGLPCEMASGMKLDVLRSCFSNPGTYASSVGAVF